MNNPYELHSWSKHYRQELLQVVHSHQILSSTPSARGAPSSRARASRLWLSILSSLRRTQLVE